MMSIYKGRLKNELTPISGCFSFSDDLLSFFSETHCALFQTTFRSSFVGILGVKPLKDTASRQSRPMLRLRAGQSGSAVW